MNQLKRIIPALALALLSVQAPAQTGPIAEIGQGRVRGFSEDGIHNFRNIPFAAPPVGELRWRRAQPAGGWPDTRDATAFGAVCPQRLMPGRNAEGVQDRPMDEDCLYLNVWTPDLNPREPLAVMVWILPGGFTFGDAGMPVYNGSGLARQGVVVVTFNQRLGFLGQFAHPALSALEPDHAIGNFYLSDQLAALEWVRDNISAFGGDPGNVTIFGMSAGGVAVNYLLAMPAARGLFHKAASQSSSVRPYRPRHLSDNRDGRTSLETTGLDMARSLGVHGSGDEAVRGLRALVWQEIFEYQDQLPLGSMNPAVDGRFLPEALGPVFSEGRQHDVPYLTGATSWEGSLLMRMDNADLLLDALGISRDEIRDLYGEVDERTILNNLEFDTFFGSQRWLARQHARAGKPTFLYHFDYVYEKQYGSVPGAFHGAETAYVFRTLDTRAPDGPTEQDWAMSELVSAYWVGFAKTGDPNGAGRPVWPLHTRDSDILLDFGQDGAKPVIGLEQRRMQFMENRYDSGRM